MQEGCWKQWCQLQTSKPSNVWGACGDTQRGAVQTEGSDWQGYVKSLLGTEAGNKRWLFQTRPHIMLFPGGEGLASKRKWSLN